MKILLIALLACLTTLAWADPVLQVQWEYPTSRTDGSELTNLAGARIYYGTEPGVYTERVEVAGTEPGATGTASLSNLVEGVVYYITGTAFDAAGLESDFATEISKSFTIGTTPAVLNLLTGSSTDVYVLVIVWDSDQKRFVRRMMKELVE
jgi:hypothetical protein